MSEQISFEFTVKNADWFILRHGPVILDLMASRPNDEFVGYSYEDYIESLYALIEVAKDRFADLPIRRDEPGSLGTLYQGAQKACDSFIAFLGAARNIVRDTS